MDDNKRSTTRTNEVTAYSIYKALRETTANALSAKGIAAAANIDATSENLQAIKDELFSAAMLDGSASYKRVHGVTWYWLTQ